MRDSHTRNRRAPPAIVLGSAALAAAVLWLVVRLLVAVILAAELRLRMLSFSLPALFPLGPTTTLVVCFVVAVLAALDSVRLDESVFHANVGRSRRDVIALAAGCALLLELVLAILLRAATGG